ncbi:hypothetical protein [Clostridium sp. 001]|uniref:hypothetical protein n=1 Tax=Clostridium sp. 001 TaxID=1970093 RepID=UPI001C2B9221|nr:hypothetical protein [Clostridium sp. 001]QXE20013.1 hypothetical protein B5S50_14935 [Clostridium sp. 001]
MNKKVKILSSTLAALLLTSGITLTNVQAQGVQNNSSVKSVSNINTLGKTQFLEYMWFPHNQVEQMSSFLQTTTNVNDFVRFLTGDIIVSGSLAEKVGPSLFFFGKNNILAQADHGKGVLLYTPSQDYCKKFTLVPFGPAGEDNFDVYYTLTGVQAHEIENYIDLYNPQNSTQLANFMVEKSILSDPTYAKGVATVIFQSESYFKANDQNGVLILQAQSNPEIKYVATSAR